VPAQDITNGVVVNIIQGDIVVVWDMGNQIKIRLYGIDTPNEEQPFFQPAIKSTADIVFNKTLKVIPYDTDTTGLIHGIIYIKDQCLNETLVHQGMAWVDKTRCTDPVCQVWVSLQNEAQQKKRGLWSQKDPQPPWKFAPSQNKAPNKK
jgi:endonuclease YncB( thermonuclease family)